MRHRAWILAVLIGLLGASLATTAQAQAEGAIIWLRNGERLLEGGRATQALETLEQVIRATDGNGLPLSSQRPQDADAAALLEALQRGQLHPYSVRMMSAQIPALTSVLDGGGMGVPGGPALGCEGGICPPADIARALSQAEDAVAIPDTPGIRALLDRHQDHVLRFWDELTEPQRQRLLAQIEDLDWTQLDPLIQSHVLNRPVPVIPESIEPAPVLHREPGPGQAELYARARTRGDALLRAGKVAAFTVAGGQGSRLGIDGPKGIVQASPDGEHSLFEIFAANLLAARRTYGSRIPWYIMTSPQNHAQTLAYFEQHDWFGLPREDVILFRQGVLPAFDTQGKLLLAEPGELALAPDGHGGSLRALARSGSLQDMKERGIEVISYFQVDNPLVQPFDPLFLGLHAETGSEMSTKVVTKADDLEKVGNLVLADGTVQLVEYSEFPEELSHQKNPDGSRAFNAGNIAIHAIDVGFIDRVVQRSFQLPFRRADKAVSYVNEAGTTVRPEAANAVKLEAFVFDVLPLANHAMLLEVSRADEFAPVKNATGVDSLESSRVLQNERAARWLEAAGVTVPRNPDGTSAVTIYMAPTFATTPEDVAAHLAKVPPLKPGDVIELH